MYTAIIINIFISFNQVILTLAIIVMIQLIMHAKNTIELKTQIKTLPFTFRIIVSVIIYQTFLQSAAKKYST